MAFLNKKYSVQIYRYILSCLVLVSISWVHYFNTNSLEVDNNSIQPLFFNLLLSSIVVGVIVYLGVSTYKIVLSKEDFSNNELRSIFYILVVVSGTMLPLFSNDFFSFIGYADVSLQGCLVYSNPSCSNQSVFLKYISPLYQNIACKYGPLNLFIAQFSYKMGGLNLLYCYFWYKIVLILFGILYVEGALLLKNIKSVDIYYKLILFNPLWWLQGVGQGHNDFFAITMIVFAIYFMLKRKLVYCILLIIIAIFFKYTYLFLLCLPVLFCMYEDKKWISMKIVLVTLFSLVLFIVMALLFYTPLVNEYVEIVDSFKVMSTGGPSSTFTDIFSFIALVFNNNFIENSIVFGKIFQFIGLFLMLIFGFLFLKNKEYLSLSNIFHLLIAIFIVLIFVFSHRFLPWYLMIVPILLAFSFSKEWLIYFIVMFIFSTFQDISVMISTNQLAGQILMAVSTIIVVFFNFYALKSRFWKY